MEQRARMSDEMPASQLCSLDIHGAVARLTLRRSDVFNALNVQLISELVDALHWMEERSVGTTQVLADPDGAAYLRVIVLRGDGKHFCAGADINMMRDAGAAGPAANRADSERLDRLFNSLWAHPCFTIGAIQGVALGGGAGLVACVDHSIGEPRTRIALSEGKLGILPAVIGPYVYRRLGSAQFRRLSMLASRVSAEEGLRIGWLNEVVDSPLGFDEAIDRTIGDVLTTGPMAVAESKRLAMTFDRWMASDEELRLWTLDKTSQMRGSGEGQEGLSSFLERRKPDWAPEE
ncbi:MAG: gamma-carboxygeranoyl-CoA hydratase [Candidatus Poseidoniales archaeon]|nr:enoyl-CoA hydratase-related protein [Candidatus Thalassarchaeaceae archaeon]RCH71830.1 MAG: gamma-carboxygeranoyl-CoA hydratase [Candidatus Poseidoniales archaeon]RCH72576.1 MAG: gamma-carboxygeranoyl-CoA hydratase [Candidatus Poseidoniales archaeon]|tara:strand:+ start:11459 stop:12331 length:873 start_codon:yes stop_codon:yes gene_type:complete